MTSSLLNASDVFTAFREDVVQDVDKVNRLAE